MSNKTNTDKPKRGFAAMTPEQRRQASSKGGKKGAKDGAIKGFATFDEQKHKEVSRSGGRRSRRKDVL